LIRGARVAAFALALAVGPARPAGPVALPPADATRAPGYASQAGLTPSLARLGAPVVYRGRVEVPPGTDLRWAPPRSGGALEWGAPRARRLTRFEGNMGRARERDLAATMEIEVPLQVFAVGYVSVPGLGFQVRGPDGAWRWGRLPVVRLGVIPSVAPQDTSARLRPLRGPLGAPWWEVVPWRVVGGVALGVAAALLVARRLRRKRGRPTGTAAPPRAARAPDAAALAALAELRGRRLPEAGRFAEHAFELTAILRRFLEASGEPVRPGDSTSELVVHLESAALAPEELARLGGLLAAWDRVKFARAASDADEARRAETAVEGWVRRRARPAGGGGA
jgi:hypothetical protein